MKNTKHSTNPSKMENLTFTKQAVHKAADCFCAVFEQLFQSIIILSGIFSILIIRTLLMAW